MDKLYNMICENNEEVVVRANKRGYVAAEDKKLELRLGPPGGEDRQSLLSLGYCNNNNNNIPHEAKRVCHEEKKEERKWLANSSSSDPAASASELTNSAAARDSDQKSKSRIVQAPVVGWPPIRSSRKNLAIRSSSSSSFANPPADSELPNETSKEGDGKSDSTTYSKHHKFVKINMEGVPIGRKINLKAYDSYEKLSFAIYELFQGLLAAQRVCCGVEKEDKKGETKSKSESLHGNGEYTLLYEDNEGDRMLVGDVPWNMFASTAKRLRVLKSSQLSTLQLSSSQLEKTPLDSTMEVGI